MDATGQYKRPEVLNFQANRKVVWNNDELMRGENGKHGEDVVEKAIDAKGSGPSEAWQSLLNFITLQSHTDP